ncbi:MAG: glutathione peroxidase [Pseudomonadota bacterium]
MSGASVYGFQVRNIKGENVSLEQYRGKTLLIVNVASQCGFTPQYKGLEELYQKYSDRGLVILGFPCNQFGGQEPGTDAEIATFCETNFGVTFPMFGKIDVNGAGTAPVYKYLKSEAPGLLGTVVIKWNFTKFLVDKSGKVIKRYAPTDTPEAVGKDLEVVL